MRISVREFTLVLTVAVFLVSGALAYILVQTINETGRVTAAGLKAISQTEPPQRVNRAAKGDRYRRPVGLYLDPYLSWEHNAII